ncbi:GtrA family protein [Streptomyces sp. NPDC015130]|uniref:GtrA family protein n=1 Tax=Streptomyces sp. NPDC015130 TaxID=3364940 RepID=UPI0036FF252D
METAQSRRHATPGAFTAFARFVLCGGGVGIASSFAVTGLASWIPWFLANALTAVASTLLSTELHARFTFGAGGRATWRQHTQSAGSAAAAYVVTCGAMLLLQQLVTAPSTTLEQAVYLTASALAGAARFVVLRVVVFARTRTRTRNTTTTTTTTATAAHLPHPTHPTTPRVPRPTPPADRTTLCRAA